MGDDIRIKTNDEHTSTICCTIALSSAVRPVNKGGDFLNEVGGVEVTAGGVGI